MIHEVRLSHETKYYLWQITHLQIDVLACAVQLQSNFTEQELQTALTCKMSQKRAIRVANWICRHRDTREGLQTFVTGIQCERQGLVDSMQRDVLRLYCGQRDKTLECCFADDRHLPAYQEGAKQFLLAFYEQLSNGIPTDILASNPGNYPRYGREQFFKAYEKANPRQSVCAICDEHRPITIIRGHFHSDIEHYFPKSVYPHLACHPYNLIPICQACNSAHQNKDPLQGRGCSPRRRNLGEVFLPYRNESVRSHGAVIFDGNKPDLFIVERNNNNNSLSYTRVMAFLEIYDVPQRWQSQIHRIGEQLWRKISHFALAEIEKNEVLDVFKVKTALERLLNYFIEDLGATSWDYVLIWYLSYLLVTEIETAIQNHQSPHEVPHEVPLIQTLDEIIKKSSPDVSVLRAYEVLKISRGLYNQGLP
jgi:5-methylcytosine-specific restriction endonuclease McrA